MLRAGYRPRVVDTEINARIDAALRVSVPDDGRGLPNEVGDGFFSASLGAYFDLLRAHGYSLVHVESLEVNAFFVRDDVLQARFPNFAPPLGETWLHLLAPKGNVAFALRNGNVYQLGVVDMSWPWVSV